MKNFIFIYISIMASLADTPSSQCFFSIWNIGQGQWITEVTPDRCSHFDFGGELQFFQAIESRLHLLCFRKTNELYLSHADLDHFAFLPLLISRMTKLCWKIKPVDPRLKRFNSIPNCSLLSEKKYLTQNFLIECDPEKRNDCSSIFRRGDFLFPGDSPIKKENLWIPDLTTPEKIKVLVLGHHGSATSTGNLLIKRLSRLHTAVASARTSVYGHPNQKVRKRLMQRGIRILKTESWGNLIFLQN